MASRYSPANGKSSGHHGGHRSGSPKRASKCARHASHDARGARATGRAPHAPQYPRSGTQAAWNSRPQHARGSAGAMTISSRHDAHTGINSTAPVLAEALVAYLGIPAHRRLTRVSRAWRVELNTRVPRYAVNVRAVAPPLRGVATALNYRVYWTCVQSACAAADIPFAAPWVLVDFTAMGVPSVSIATQLLLMAGRWRKKI